MLWFFPCTKLISIMAANAFTLFLLSFPAKSSASSVSCDCLYKQQSRPRGAGIAAVRFMTTLQCRSVKNYARFLSFRKLWFECAFPGLCHRQNDGKREAISFNYSEAGRSFRPNNYGPMVGLKKRVHQSNKLCN